MTTLNTTTEFLHQHAEHLSRHDLTAQHTIVCANAQQSHWLAADWIQQRSEHHDTFFMPHIMSFSQWLEHLYVQAPDCTAVILSHNQQILLWHHVLTQINLPLLKPQLWSMAQQYHHHRQQETQQAHQQHTESDSVFSEASRLYCQYLSQHQCIDHSGLEHSFSDWYKPNPIQKTTFVGFHSLNPSHQQILHHLSNHALFYLQPPVKKPNITVSKLHSEHDQINHLINTLSHHLSNPTPSTLGIVLPKTSDFQKLVAPCQAALSLLDTTQAQQISSFIPQPLSDFALCQSLNLILNFFLAPSSSTLSRIFSLPCFQHPQFSQTHCQQVLQTLAPIPLSQWQHIPDSHFQSPSHVACWTQLCSFIALDVTQPQTFQQWTMWFRDLMSTHFQSFHPQNERQATLFSLWVNTIDQAKPLTVSAHESFDYNRWLDMVSVHLNNTYYNNTRHSNVVVMSWSQALEMPFDNLIFLSCHQATWPPSIDNHKTAEPRRQRLDHIHHVLTHSTPTIHFLCPQYDAMSQPLMPCAILDNHSDHALVTPPKYQPYYILPKQSVARNIPVFGPKISPSERVISTSVIQAYSRCHAQGFLSHRLGIHIQSADLYGITQADVGILIHELLAEYDVITTTDIPEKSAVDASLNALFTRHIKYRYLPKLQKNTLRIHLNRLLTQWIQYRIDAHQNDSIIASQHEVTLEKNLFGMTLKIRLDRIDTYSDHSHRIIDYKTGLTQRSSWLKSPPQNPQLLVYALSLGKTSAIAYASLHPEQYGYSGYGHWEHDLPGIKPMASIALKTDPIGDSQPHSWPRQIAIWQRSIAALIQAYQAGSMRINPVDTKNTCQQCQLQAVCRLYEHTAVVLPQTANQSIHSTSEA